MSRLILNFLYILLFDERLTKMVREARKWPFMASVVIYESGQVAGRDVVSV